MNAKRLNLVACVRAALEQGGYSTVKVVNAVNSELGRLEATKGGKDAALGDGRLTKTEYKVTENLGSAVWKGARTPGLEFDAWHCLIAKANKAAEMDFVSIPAKFTPWLQSMKADVAKAAPVASAAAPAAAPAAVPAGK